MYATVIATIYDSRAIDSEEGSGRANLRFFRVRLHRCNADFKLRTRAALDLITERDNFVVRKIALE